MSTAVNSAAAGTCHACQVAFDSVAELRAHYQTDLHVLNVKARVEGQAKISAGEYRRSIAMSESDPLKPVYACKLCKKTFHTVQTLQSHVRSTDHLMRKEQRIMERESAAGSIALSSASLGSAALGLHRRYRTHAREKIRLAAARQSAGVLGEGSDIPPEKPKVSFDDREADVTETRCLLCGHPSKTMRSNLKHMMEIHDFSVPLSHRVNDMRALLQYLSRKINGLMCLVCGDRTKKFESLESLRAHMIAVRHERIVLSSEYAAFYTGALDDGDPAELPTVDGGSAALVVRGDRTKRITKKDDTGFVRRIHETQTEMLERRAIAAAGQEETQMMLKERRKDTQKERTLHFKTINQHYARQKYFNLKVGMKKLHAKGYDGEGEVN